MATASSAMPTNEPSPSAGIEAQNGPAGSPGSTTATLAASENFGVARTAPPNATTAAKTPRWIVVFSLRPPDDDTRPKTNERVLEENRSFVAVTHLGTTVAIAGAVLADPTHSSHD